MTNINAKLSGLGHLVVDLCAGTMVVEKSYVLCLGICALLDAKKMMFVSEKL